MTRLTLTLALLLSLLAPAGAWAVHPPVTNTNDSGPGSLRSSLAATVDGDTVAVPAGTYRLSSQLTVGQDVTIVGPSAKSTVIDGQGITRLFNVTATGQVTIDSLSVIRGRATGNGGGILHTGGGALEIIESTIRNHVANAGAAIGGGGGGLHHTGGLLTIRDSTISHNTANVAGAGSGGGGLFASPGGEIRNSTISGNRLNGGTGGGGYFSGGGGLLSNVTLLGNSTNGPPGGGIFTSGAAVDVSNTIIANNAAGSSANCGGIAISSGGSNLDSGTTCGLVGELSNTNPLVGGLEDNGGQTPTHRLLPGSPAIDAGNTGTACEDDDQRGAERPASDNDIECDIGAYEFDGLAQLTVPNCSRTGQIPFQTFSPPGAGVEALNYKIDGGAQLQVGVLGAGTTSVSGLVLIPEGRRQVEYWADSTPTGAPGGEFVHHFPQVVVDRTNPLVAVRNPNKFKVFVIKRSINVNVNASDSISGLTTDPSGAKRIATAKRGTQTYTPAAVDLCANQSTAPFNYKVLAPRLGTRTVIEELSGNVKVAPRRSSSAGARASQKGQRFSAFRQPRELAIGSFVDTRRGTARITSSSNRGSGLKDSTFVGGVFQVLESRARRAKAVTELRLKGGSFSRCRRVGRGKGANASRLSRKTIRRLRARAKGRFRTRGRHSAATVRGTTFTVSDRCDGTLTVVKRGRVAVRDFRRKKTVIVRAGKRYLARAPQ